MGLHPAERVREYRDKGYWTDDMIDALLRERVRVHGDIPAILDPLNRQTLLDGPFRSLTWPQLDEEVSRLAQVLLDQGIRTGDLQKLAWIVVAFVLTGLAAFGLSSLQTYLTGWVGERALADLRIRLFTHLQRLSLGYFERNRTGAIISRITNDVEALDTLITDGVTSLVQNTMLLIGTAIVLFLLFSGAFAFYPDQKDD